MIHSTRHHSGLYRELHARLRSRSARVWKACFFAYVEAGLPQLLLRPVCFIRRRHVDNSYGDCVVCRKWLR